MGRRDDDFDRRRLRGLYDRNRSRVIALAEARDRRGDGRGERAPRSYVVSERTTRLEGFGRRGGARVQRVIRVVTDRPRRFNDRSIFRGSGRERFVRESDFDRSYRRERFSERRLRGPRRDRGGDRDRERRDRGVRQFGSSRRLRIRERDDFRRERRHGDRGDRRQGGDRRRGDEGRGGGRGGRSGRGGRGGGRGGRGGSRGPALTRDQLDSQLDNFRNN